MLNLIYRPCHFETDSFIRTNVPRNRPDWFDKFTCYKSFLISALIAKEKVNKITIVFNGEKGSFYDYLLESGDILSKNNIKFSFVEIEERSRVGSINAALKIACEDNENTYTVDDDYLHLPECIFKIANSIQRFGILTTYDHLDRYTRTDDIEYKKEIVFDFHSNHHWRTTESTCHAYAISKQMLQKIKDILFLPQYQEYDRELWIHLHKIGIPLWSCMPSLTTHAHEDFLAPAINWEKLNNFVKEFKLENL